MNSQTFEISNDFVVDVVPSGATREVKNWRVCPVCGHPGTKVHVAFDEVDFVSCTECGVVYKSREVTEIRSEDFYEKGYFQGRKSARERRFKHRVRKAKRQITAAQQFADVRGCIDIGCSLGYIIEGGKQLGLDSKGVDISEYAVSRCREKGLDAHVGTLLDVPLPDNCTDLIIMKHVLEHTPAPKDSLAQMQRLLRSGGLVLIIVPNLNYWKGWLKRRSGRYFRPDDLGRQHYVYYSARTLTKLLTSCGYRVVADSKALFRKKLAQKSPWRCGFEVARYVTLWLGHRFACLLGLRREVFMIAQSEK